jgi:hypothetical protein
VILHAQQAAHQQHLAFWRLRQITRSHNKIQSSTRIEVCDAQNERFLRDLPLPAQLESMSLHTSVTLLLLLHHYSCPYSVSGHHQSCRASVASDILLVSTSFTTTFLAESQDEDNSTNTSYQLALLVHNKLERSPRRQLSPRSRQDQTSKFVEDHMEDANRPDSRKRHSKD